MPQRQPTRPAGADGLVSAVLSGHYRLKEPMALSLALASLKIGYRKKDTFVRVLQVITLRFGLNGTTPQTLGEVGQLFGVTRERIRQIEAKALRQLRHPTRSHPLRAACEPVAPPPNPTICPECGETKRKRGKLCPNCNLKAIRERHPVQWYVCKECTTNFPRPWNQRTREGKPVTYCSRLCRNRAIGRTMGHYKRQPIRKVKELTMKVTLGALVDIEEMPRRQPLTRPWTREQIQSLPHNKALPATVEGGKRDGANLAALWRADVPKVLPDCVGFTRAISQDDGHYLVYLAIKDKPKNE